MRRVTVSIDTLAFNGFRPEDRDALAAGLQAGLARLFADPQITSNLAAAGQVSVVRAGSVHVQSGDRPRNVGAAAARQIGRGIRS